MTDYPSPIPAIHSPDLRAFRLLAACLSLLISGIACWLPGVEGDTLSKSRVASMSSAVPPTLEPFIPDVIVMPTQVEIQVSRLVVTETPVATEIVAGETWDVVVEQGDTLYSISQTECGDPRGYSWLEFLNGKFGKVLEVGETIRVNCEGVPNDNN